MIEMKTIAPVQQQDSLLLTMADLRRKRIELSMSGSTAAQYLGISYGMLRYYELRDSAPQHIFELYRDYLKSCSNGSIYYKRITLPCICKKEDRATKEQTKKLREIRVKLQITLNQAGAVLGKNPAYINNCENGRGYFSKSEYSALMKFYYQENQKRIRQGKLKRIFGSHYREDMMS